MRPHRSISQLTDSSAWYDDCGFGMSRESSGVALDSVVLRASGRRAVADLREQPGPRLRQHADGLLDVRRRDLDVEVVRERLGDQRVEHRVAELLPPLVFAVSAASFAS